MVGFSKFCMYVDLITHEWVSTWVFTHKDEHSYRTALQDEDIIDGVPVANVTALLVESTEREVFDTGEPGIWAMGSDIYSWNVPASKQIFARVPPVDFDTALVWVWTRLTMGSLSKSYGHKKNHHTL